METTAIKKLIAENKIEDAFSALLSSVEQAGDRTLFNRIILQQARFKQLNSDSYQGVVEYGDVVRIKNMISLSLLGLTDELARNYQGVEPGHSNNKIRGIQEYRFKWYILILLMLSKFIVIGFVFTGWQAGGLDGNQFTTLIGILSPLFATYIVIAVEDLMRQMYEKPQTRLRRIKSWYLYFSIFIFLIYTFVINTIIFLYLDGSTQLFTQLINMLTGTEAVLGVVLGKLIYGLFKKESL